MIVAHWYLLSALLPLLRHGDAQKILENAKASRRMPCFHQSMQCNFYNDCCDRYDPDFRKPLFTCKLAKDLGHIGFQNLENEAILMVDKCPDGTDEQLRVKCEEKTIKEGLEYIVPVLEAHKLYKNAFCSQCHRGKRLPVNMKIECMSQVSKATVLNHSIAISLILKKTCRLSVSLPPPLISRLVCTLRNSLSSACNHRQNSLDFQACQTAPTRYTFCSEQRFVVYRNIHCARCSLRPDKCTQRSITDFVPRMSRATFWNSFSYDILFNFNRFDMPITPSKKPNLIKIPLIRPTPVESLDGDATAEPSVLLSNSTNNLPNVSRVFSILSIIACCLSLIALYTLLIVYYILPRIRGFGSKIIISLAVTMVTALTLFIFGPFLSQVVPCPIIGIVMHFAYLSSFVWMSVLAFDLFKSFSSTGSVSSSQRKRPFIRLALVGWVLPALVTTGAVLVDVFASDSTISPRFGKGIRCYLHSRLGLIVWFYAPVTISVVVNVILSICLFRVLWRTSRQTRQVQGRARKQEMAFLCLKIIAIIGLTWSFSLVAVWSNNSIITGISGVINSLQGLFLALAFLGSSRVVRAMSASLSDSTGIGNGPRHSRSSVADQKPTE